jgi:AbrB family looped-hinge helix DNA binding protein
VEARARMTSKGQVTVPVEVRRALGVEAGDTLVFEVAGSYATMRKRRSTLTVAEEVRALYLGGRVPREVTNREAIEEYFATVPAVDADGALFVSAGDGGFARVESLKVDIADADR